LTLYAVRAPSVDGGGVFAPISREGGLLVNNLLLTTAATTVLLGTLYPLIADALELGKLSVGAPYFNAVFVPLMVPLVALAGVGPLLAWKRGDLNGAFQRLKVAAGAAGIVLVITWASNGGDLLNLAAGGGMALGAWLAVAALSEWVLRVRGSDGGISLQRVINLPRSAYGMTLAHLGMAVLIVGVTGASAWKEERIESLKPGQHIDVAGYRFTFDGAKEIQGPNYVALEGQYTMTKDGKTIAVLTPEKRNFSQPVQQTTEAAIYTTVISDLYAVIGDMDGAEGAFVTRIFYEPFVPFLWYGVLLMGLGGLVSLSDRRHRLGAARRAVAAALQPAE